MIIQCDKCNTKYRLDDSRVTGAGVKVKCTKCQNVFVVTQPEEAPVEELIPTAPAQSEPPMQEKPAPNKPETPNLNFDFDTSEDKPEDKRPGETSFGFKEGAPSQDKQPSSFNDIDFSFNMDSKESTPAPEKGEDDRFDIGSGLSGKEEPEAEENVKKEDSSFGDFDFNFNEDKPAEKKESEKVEVSQDDDWGLGSTEDEEPEAAPAPKEEAKPQPKAEPVVTAAAAYAKTTAPAKKDAQENLFDEKEDKFSDLLEESLKDGGKPPVGTETEEEDFEVSAPAKKASGGKKPALLIAILVFVIGGGLIYFSGIIDTLARRFTPASSTATSIKTVEIESINGYYVENKSFGKFFVVEAKLKNISDAPQAIKRVTGTVFGKDGEPIANKTVAPGRLVTPEDLKNLSKEDLQKMFKDPSGGTIPAKGTVPVMVLFTELTDGVAEYGVDIVR